MGPETLVAIDTVFDNDTHPGSGQTVKEVRMVLKN
jgi:hypothetical protein